MAFHMVARRALLATVMVTVVFAAPKDGRTLPGDVPLGLGSMDPYLHRGVAEAESTSLRSETESRHTVETQSSTDAGILGNSSTTPSIENWTARNMAVAPAFAEVLSHGGGDYGLCHQDRRELTHEDNVDYTIRRELEDSPGEITQPRNDCEGGDSALCHPARWELISDNNMASTNRLELEGSPGAGAHVHLAGDDSGHCHQASQGLLPQNNVDCTTRRMQEGRRDAEETPRAKRQRLKANAQESLQSSGWQTTAVAQLQGLRLRGRGWEPMWLAVLRRVQYRRDPDYEQWCKNYLRSLRQEFGARLVYDLYKEPLHPTERQWAANVEFATFQDYLAAGQENRAVVSQIIESLPEDGTVLQAAQPSSSSAGPTLVAQPVTVTPVLETTMERERGSRESTVQDGEQSLVVEEGDGDESVLLFVSGGRAEAVKTVNIDVSLGLDLEQVGLFQTGPVNAGTWEDLVEQFYEWFQEGRSVGMALRMARRLARERGNSRYTHWVEGPLTSLGMGIPANSGEETSVTPPDFFTWATRVEAILWRTSMGGAARDRTADNVETDDASLMDSRYRHGRRRIRDSRTPRRTTREPSGGNTSRPSRHCGAELRSRETRSSGSGSGRGRNNSRSEYVEIRLEEGPVTSEPASGSGDRPSVRPTGGSTPDITRPLTMTQSVEMWRWLLFNRSTFAPPAAGTGKVPATFLPRDTLREVSVTHEGMTPQNRLQSTVELITVIRYLMAELAQTLDVADAVARTNNGTMETSDLEGEEDEGDQTNLMQRYNAPFDSSDGKDTASLRWARALLRLQKELAGQAKAVRLQHARRLRMGTGHVETAGQEQWEQLQALLLSVVLEADAVEEGGQVDHGWLAQWADEISASIPGFVLPSAPVELESQDTGNNQVGISEADHDLGRLLADEEEERQWQLQRCREEEAERQRLENYEAMGAVEAAHLQAEAEAFQAWEDRQMAATMSRDGPPPAKKRCVLTFEAASGSSDPPTILHTLELEVPANGTVLELTLRARMAPAAESVSTIPVHLEQREEAQRVRTPMHDSHNDESVQVHLDTAPDLLPYMDFAEYEEVYRMWRAGEKTLEELTVQYGAEVADLLQAQRAVGEAEDADREHLGTRSPDAVSEVEPVPLRGRSPLCAPGQPRVRFGFFENMYGQWRSG
eukprot:s535_g1.t1